MTTRIFFCMPTRFTQTELEGHPSVQLKTLCEVNAKNREYALPG